MIATVLLHEIIWRRQTAISQLVDGLKTLNVVKLIQEHPDLLKEKFVSSAVEITKERLLEEMDVSMPHTDDEERAKSHLLAYLEIPGKIAIGEGNFQLSVKRQKLLKR